ncbi:MAG TPA: sigma 54-interacting transcriptional regulator, partial [Thermoanaerobaculia bacterium]|nr:sigma 54-interacting transcriptional regulator [Thermoanaerobaculia bacterium]
SGLERADAAYDVAHAALDGGRLDVAARELDEALALYAAARHEGRYLSALGNRIDLLLKAGDFSAARAVLARVLSHERASGRNHQILFAIPSLQELALLDGDDGEAAAAFREAEERGSLDPSHPAWREILLFEAERLLAAPDAEAALALLARAGEIPDNRSRTEGRRLRVLASASRDAGRPLREALPALSAEERALFDAETALASGRAPSDTANAALQRLASSGTGAGLAVRRVLEWRGRFPSFFATSASGPLVRLARRVAARAGLARAEQCFTRLLEHGVPAEVHVPPPAPAAFPIVAEDPATRDVFEKAARVARSTISVLLLGESGTGKEIVAQELHRLSGRRGPFVAVNVAALPGTLAEAELFGHSRGAFTGADRDRKGLVEESSGGTLFLDEIGDLPLALQGKLLRVLQENEVRRLGETAVRSVNLRVLAATHRPLKEMAEAAAFRADLYFRLAGLELELPPLRERPRDLVRFVDLALRGRARLTPEASSALRAWPWPGNVRELLAALEAAVVLAPGRVVGLEHLPRALRERSAGTRAARSYREAVNCARVEAIQVALLETKGNRTRAARQLGISRQSLLYEMKKLRIGGDSHRSRVP